MITEEKLDKKSIENISNLTPMQEGMLYQNISQDEDSYFVRLFIHVDSSIEVDLLKTAWQEIINRNEALRTILRWRGLKSPVQVTLKESILNFIYEDITSENLNFKEISNYFRKAYANFKTNLTEQLFKVALFKLNDSQYTMVVSYHHIICDGWSNGIILKEFFSTYHDLCQNRVPDFPGKARFSEFVKLIKKGVSGKDLTYWQDKLRTFSPEISLGDTFHRTENVTSTHREISIKLDPELSDKINSFLSASETSIAALTYASWSVLLHKFLFCSEITFGTTVSGRNVPLKNIENTVGLLINTVPLSVALNKDETLREVMFRVMEDLVQREDHLHVSLADLKRMADVKPGEELFRSLVIIENYPLDLKQLEWDGNLSVHSFEMDEYSDDELTLLVKMFGNPEFSLVYDTQYFSDKWAVKILDDFLKVVERFITNPDTPLKQLNLVSEAEKLSLFELSEGIKKELSNETIISVFENQAKLTPEASALSMEGRTLTYQALNESANQLANYLIAREVANDDIIVIAAERGIEQLIALIGTMKSGAAYLPLPLSLPKERAELILSEAKPRFMLTTGTSYKLSILETISLNGNQTISEYSKKNPALRVLPDQLAYTIFTSGSTGTPKGVLTEHEAIYNLINSLTNAYGIDASDKILLFNDYSFDASVEQIWLALCNGAELFLLDEPTLLNKSAFEAFLEEYQITHFDSTPAFLRQIEPKKYHHLKRIVVGGEVCDWGLVEKWSKKYDFFNAYGPTETTVTSLINKVESNQKENSFSVPIGKPIANTQAYILNEEQELQPLGVSGELYIGGAQLARGYLKQPQLTSARFIASPFKPGERLYKTGDRARWLADGNIEFLGRNDDQVKVRGFRIELGEIESQLSSHAAVTSAVVLAAEKEHDKYLVAYYTAEATTTATELKAYLQERLPDYMVPLIFMKLEALPLNRSGKVDRKALPEPEMNLAETYVAPQNDIEEQLVTIWSEVLQLPKDQISTTSNFFELGGHSLKATLVVNQLLKTLQVDLPVKDLFVYQSIQGLAEHIKHQTRSEFESIPQAPNQESYPLTSAQKRLYFLYEFDPEATAYNMPYVLELRGELDTAKLEGAFRALLERHESLRTRFVKEGETAFQQIVSEAHVAFSISQLELAGHETPEAKIRSFIQPFDLSQAPLFRIAILKVSENAHLLLTDWHHIITDGTSQAILIKDFMDLYAGKSLAPLNTQYKDYATWKSKQSEFSQESLQSFWTDTFAAPVEAVELPTDHPRSSSSEKRGAVFTHVISGKSTQALQEVSAQNGATLFMTMLALLNVLLSKLSNQKDLVIGTPVAGRDHADTQKLIGLFINTLALRNYPEPSLTFRQFLAEVKEGTLKCFEYSQYPFEELIEKLNLARTTQRNPLFDVMFAVQNFEEEALKLPGLKLTPQAPQEQLAKFDLSITVEQRKDTLELSWEYDCGLFKAETIERFATYYERLIQEVSKNADQELRLLKILPEAEQVQLQKFNETKIDYPLQSIIELFQEQAESTPAKIAVILKEAELTYEELAEKSTQLAKHLHEKGIERNEIVGVLLDQSLELFHAILGINKSGAAFLPIDPSLPKERIHYMLEDSQAKYVISSAELIKSNDLSKSQVIDVGNGDLYTKNDTALPFPSSKDLAYVIYTSGTTGTPKGTLIEHGSLTNLCHWFNERYEVSQTDHTTKLAGLGFDAMLLEVFPPLLKGATIHVMDEEDRLNPSRLNAYFESNEISLSFLPTPLCEPFLKLKNNSLRVLLTGGDKLNNATHNNQYKLYDNYGPTETTVVATSFLVGAEQVNTLIGKPIANTQAYILNEEQELQPLGVSGELYIGGAQLARGYLRQPQLTAARFIASPFKPGERLYKTGDRARWLADGNIEFLGRNDDQVKVRGFRIELGEIESQLSNHAAVISAVVLAAAKEHGKYLVAYYTAESTTTVTELKAYLQERLPDYMVPSIFMKLEALPLNRSGKVDRKALPEPEMNLAETYVAPQNDIEEQLVRIWSEVLQIPDDEISTTSNFFELGGHSLKAGMIIDKVHLEMGIKLPVIDFFNRQTILEMADLLQAIKLVNKPKIDESNQIEITL